MDLDILDYALLEHSVFLAFLDYLHHFCVYTL
jgi:hypothetical protein